MPQKRVRTWLLVADGVQGRVYAKDGRTAALKPVDGLAFERPRERAGDILADRPGRVQESANAARHAMEPRSDPVREAQRKLANEMMETLARQHSARAFDQLAIVAAPAMLGDLRDAMPDTLRQVVTGELAKDLTKLPVKELETHLANAGLIETG